jgi:hypothetical protein
MSFPAAASPKIFLDPLSFEPGALSILGSSAYQLISCFAEPRTLSERSGDPAPAGNPELGTNNLVPGEYILGAP